MSDLERDAEQIGRRIWPDPRAVLGGLSPRRRQGWRRLATAGAFAATAAAAALALVLGLAFTGGRFGGDAPSGLLHVQPASPTPIDGTARATLPPSSPPPTVVPHTVDGSPQPTALGTAPATPRSTPTPSPPPGTSPATGTITLTEADDRRTIRVTRGTTIVVRLSASSMYRWTEPQSSDAHVLPRTGGAANPDGSATATFGATAPGQAQITATDDPTCYPQCLPPSRLWQVTVDVTG